MSTDTTCGLYPPSVDLSDLDIRFLSLYAAGASLEKLGRYVLGIEGTYMSVCGKAFRYRNSLLMRLGLDPTLPHRVVRSKLNQMLSAISASFEDGITAQDLFRASFEEQVKYMQTEIGLPDRSPTPPPPAGSSDEMKILVLSDLHVPFHNVELLTSAIREHSDAHTVVLLGDFLDMYSASRFSRSRHISIEEELRQAAAILEVLSSTFQRVIVLEGNHDTRAQRWLQTNRPEIGPLLLHPFEYIRYRWSEEGVTARYQNVEFHCSHVQTSGPESPVALRHFILIGDALLGHFERSLKGNARTVQTLALEWLPQWEGYLFGVGQVRVVVQAHVHRLSKVQWGRYTLFECGCIADVMKYALVDPKFGAPQPGYVVLYQRNGVTDVNRSQYISYNIYDRGRSYGTQAS